METLLGGLLGGLFRLAPEFLKWFDRKDERRHELAMTDKQLEFERLRGSQKMAEIGAAAAAAYDTAALEALKEGIKAQAQPSGVKWVDALGAAMRPLITLQWVLLLYPAQLIVQWYLLVQAGTPNLEAFALVFGPDEKAIAAGIINFWFLHRTLRNRPA